MEIDESKLSSQARKHLDVKTRGRTSKDLQRKFNPYSIRKLVGYAFPENEVRFQKVGGIELWHLPLSI